MVSISRRRRSPLPRLILLCGLLSIFMSLGCRRAAYTEMYIEQLNNEARQLEDRIYEYDSAYRGLELEINALQHENERLRQQLEGGTRGRLRPTPNQESPGMSFEELPARPQPLKSTPTPSPTPTPTPGTTPKPNATEKSPAAPATPAIPPPVIESVPLEPPSIEFNLPPSALNDRESPGVRDVGVLTDLSQPSNHQANSIQAAIAIAPTDNEDAAAELASNRAPLNQEETAAHEADEQDLVDADEPAWIDAQLPFDLDAEVEQAQAYSPHLQLAASTPLDAETRSVNHPSNTTDQATQVVELTFHPAFTRGLDADNVIGEESLRLVVQPKTSNGQVVPAAGHMTIVAIDPYAQHPEQTDAPVRLGRWTLTPEQLDEFYEPIGSSRGYRFELGPLTAVPVKGEVMVFVRLEYEDGRKLVNQFAVHLDTDPTDKPIWTARAK